MKEMKFSCAYGKYEPLIDNLVEWFDEEGFETQKFTTDDDGILVQAAKRGSWRNFVGMSSALNVAFYNEDGEVLVKMGSGKWIDKAVIGTVSLFFFWPLSITTGIGVWQQLKLPDRINDIIEQNL